MDKKSTVGSFDAFDMFAPTDMTKWEKLLPEKEREQLLPKLRKCVAKQVIFV